MRREGSSETLMWLFNIKRILRRKTERNFLKVFSDETWGNNFKLNKDRLDIMKGTFTCDAW